MREFINLLEQADNVTLYRGDSGPVEKFELAKTDSGALLGIGIYLTDSPEVAGDYTVKGSQDIAYPSGRRGEDNSFNDPKQLTAGYLRKLMNDAGFQQQMDDTKNQWQDKYYSLSRDIDWTDHERARKERDEMQAKFQADYQVVRSKMIRAAVAKAKAQFKAIRPNLRMVKLTTGEYIFTKVGRAASIAKFIVPTAYLERCLHAERPLPDDLLPIMKAAFARVAHDKNPDQKWDLRVRNPKGNNGDEDIGLSFDEFIAGFRKAGARYAWTDEVRGGKGENPSLDILWNGTHSGYHVFQNKEAQETLMHELMAMGYVGYAYDGGVRLAGTGARGGGGIRHNAYVLWDENAVHSFRVEGGGVTDDEVGDLEKGIKAAKVLR
jgi:hypothetical protein